jgi:hypothetical protein
MAKAGACHVVMWLGKQTCMRTHTCILTYIPTLSIWLRTHTCLDWYTHHDDSQQDAWTKFLHIHVLTLCMRLPHACMPKANNYSPHQVLGLACVHKNTS